MQDVQDPVARLRSYRNADPGNVDLACELADALVARGQLSEALEVLQELSPDASVARGVRFRLARLALLRGDYEQAEQALRMLLASGTDTDAVYHDLGFAQLCMRKPDSAFDTACEAIGRFGLTPELGVLKARAAAMSNDYETALAALEQVLAANPDEPAALGVRALILLDSDRLADASEASRRCLEIDPDQHEALLVAGAIALRMQDADAAVRFYQGALQRHPSSGRALSGYGQAMMLRADLEGARALLEAAVLAMPDHIGTWHALAWNQLLRSDKDSADSSYRKAYELDRNFGDTHGGLALIAVLRGDLEAAQASIKRAMRLDPESVTAKYAKTLLLEAQGETEAGEALMEELTRTARLQIPAPDFGRRLKNLLHARQL